MIRGSRRARFWAGFALPLLLGMSLAAAAQAPSAAGLQPIPKLSARVTDLTGTLTAEQQTTLEQKLAAFQSAKGSQLAVLIVPTTQPEDIFQYSVRVVEQWKLGRTKVDDGALLIVAKNDRRVWIQVGYGLEGVLTDAICSRIVAETVTPAFRQGNFYGGIDGAVDQMIKLIDGEPLPPPQAPGSAPVTRLMPELLFAVLIGSVVLRGIFGRTLGSAFTGVGAGLLVWLAAHALLLAGLAAVGAFVLALLLGVARGSGWSSMPRSGGFGGGGFGGGGFGGGGFSGGGGGFGGGGAGGSW